MSPYWDDEGGYGNISGMDQGFENAIPSWAGQATSIGAERSLGDTPMTAPLLSQAWHWMRGTEPPQYTLNDYAMGMMAGPLRGPKINVPSDLASILKGGANTMAEWTGLSRPWSGIYKGALEQGRTTPSSSWQNPMEFNLGVDLPGLLRQMGPATNLYAPEFLRNAEFFKRIGWF